MISKRQEGFSLIELLIVVAVIGILAAIAIPNLLASRRAANEGSAQSSLRTIHSGESSYKATAGNGKFGDLGNLKNANILDSLLGAGSKSGYTFTAIPDNSVNPTNYYSTAVPSDTAAVTRTGNRTFAMIEDGLLRGKVSDSPPTDRADASNSVNWPPTR